MLNILFIYDISNNRIRRKIFETCKDFGLTHIQYSAFAGNISKQRYQKMLAKCEKLIGEEEGKIAAFPVCENCSGSAVINELNYHRKGKTLKVIFTRRKKAGEDFILI